MIESNRKWVHVRMNVSSLFFFDSVMIKYGFRGKIVIGRRNRPRWNVIFIICYWKIGSFQRTPQKCWRSNRTRSCELCITCNGTLETSPSNIHNAFNAFFMVAVKWHAFRHIACSFICQTNIGKSQNVRAVDAWWSHEQQQQQKHTFTFSTDITWNVALVREHRMNRWREMGLQPSERARALCLRRKEIQLIFLWRA